MQEVEREWLVEVGWHVRSIERRRGYAAEAAGAVRDAARGLGVEHLVAYKNGGPALIFGADLRPRDSRQ